MQSPLLTTPTQYDYDNPVVELNERVIRTWVDELPLLNLAESIDAVFNAIKPLNEQSVNDKLRLRLLELYFEPVSKIVQSFDLKSFRHSAMPEDAKQQIIDDISFLNLEMANGYKILVKDGFVKQKNPQKDSQHLLATYRAMEMLGEAILHSYQLYNTPPAFAYLEFHQLYQYAERNKAADQVLRKTGKSITQLYIQILLTAIADPYRIPEGELRSVYNFLEHYTSICLLSHQPPVVEEDIALFTVDLAGDCAPRPISRHRTYKRSPDFRVLDVRPVLATLLQQVKKKSNKNQAVSMQEKILSRLVPNLTAVPQRSEPRKKQRRKVSLACGVEAVHFYLAGNIVRESAGSDDYGVEVINVEAGDDHIPQLTPWIIANESQRGYLLYQPSENKPDIQIGNLVGIDNEADGEGFSMIVATVRWMRMHVDSQNQIGVEIISRQARAATVENAYSKQPCILLGDNRIVLPNGQWEPAMPLQLQEQDATLTLQQKVAETPHYQVYQYT